MLASGDVEQAIELAERVGAADPTNRLARLALGRPRRSRPGSSSPPAPSSANRRRGRSRTSSPTLVSAWSWQGSDDTASALKTADTLGGNELAELFRDLHAGLIAEQPRTTQAEADVRLAAAYKLNDSSSFVVVDAYARSLARDGKTKEAIDVYNDAGSSG